MSVPIDANDSQVDASVAVCLWFDGNGRQAAEFYTSLIAGSAITAVRTMPDGTELLIEFELGSRRFQALNGGPQFKPNEAMSIVLSCGGQADADRLWSTLTADGGEEGMCGWLTDRFGVSWQIVPSGLDEVLFDPDPERAARAQAAMFEMRRLDIATIRAAADDTSAADA